MRGLRPSGCPQAAPCLLGQRPFEVLFSERLPRNSSRDTERVLHWGQAHPRKDPRDGGPFSMKTTRRATPYELLCCWRASLRFPGLLLGQLQEEVRRRQHAVVEAVEVQLLVGGVGVLVGKPVSHEEAGDLQELDQTC